MGIVSISLAVWGGCRGEAPPLPVDPVPVPRPLDPVARAIRLSMTLRGVRPTVEDLEQVREDPDRIGSLVDVWLESPEFAEVVRDLHAEILLTRADGANRLEFPPIGVMEGYAQGEIDVSTSEAPLRFVEEIVREDRPYTEILTADYTLADAVVARIYGLAYDPAGPEWQHTRWVDGRAHAGLLSDSAIWRRQVSNGYNYHRGRADFLADAFLCSAFSARSIPLEGGVDTSSDAGVADAIANKPSCQGCHHDLDPLAATLFGFRRDLDRNNIAQAHLRGCIEEDDADLCYPLTLYRPERETEWADHDLPGPAYFGEPIDGLVDLGEAITHDPRFPVCMARRFEAWLTQTDLQDLSTEHAEEMAEVFVDSGWSARALIRAIVTSERYDHASPGLLPVTEAAPVQVVRPETYARAVEALTGFRWWVSTDAGYGCPDGWCWGTVDLSTTDKFGYRYLAGGISGVQIVQPIHLMGPVRSLEFAAISREAAGFVVRSDFDLPAAERRLLSRVERDTRDEDAIRDQLATLHGRILGELEPGDSLNDTFALWQVGLAENNDPADAWKLVIAAMLQDPAMVFY